MYTNLIIGFKSSQFYNYIRFKCNIKTKLYFSTYNKRACRRKEILQKKNAKNKRNFWPGNFIIIHTALAINFSRCSSMICMENIHAYRRWSRPTYE